MIKTSIENLAEPIGFDIAMSDDQTQANLLNGLARGFETYNKNQYEMQLAYLTDKLDKNSEKLILALAEFVNLKTNK